MGLGSWTSCPCAHQPLSDVWDVTWAQEKWSHNPSPSSGPGAVLVSGVYNLEPILRTYVNDALNMSR